MSLMNDFTRNLLSWGLNTAKSTGQQAALRALDDAMKQLNNVAVKYAPDAAPAAATLSQTLVATLVAGIATRKS